MSDDEPEWSRRQLGRRRQRQAGEEGAHLAKVLMGLPTSALAKLELDEDLAEAVHRARAVNSQHARRRAERTLAGELRRSELGDLKTRLANVQKTGMAEPERFKRAEAWRARLIADGPAAAANLPGAVMTELEPLIERARSERDTGRPPGAARALFRYIVARLSADAPGRDDDHSGRR